MRLSGGVNLCQERETFFVDGLVYGIAFVCDDKIHVPLRIDEDLLPQAIRIRRLFPWPVISFVDNLPQRHSCLLKHSNMIADVHQVC